VSKRLADVRAAPGPLAHARLGPLRASKFRERTGARFRPNGGVHVGLALARIQLIGEQAILKRGSPGAPRLTALGLDREAARRARQRVSAEIVALPLPCSSSSQGVAAAIGVMQQSRRLDRAKLTLLPRNESSREPAPGCHLVRRPQPFRCNRPVRDVDRFRFAERRL
jgi:hypothetical protein